MTYVSLVMLVIFFVVQGVVLGWLIKNQLRMRATLHRLANALTIVSMSLSRGGHQRQSQQVADIAHQVEQATSSSLP